MDTITYRTILCHFIKHYYHLLPIYTQQGDCDADVITMEMPPTAIKSFSAEPELESADYSPQTSSKPNIRKLQRANQDLSKRNQQLSKSVESLKKENEQLKAGKKSFGRKKSNNSLRSRSGRSISLSEGGDEMDSVLPASVQTQSQYEVSNKLTVMEDLVAERDREIAELKKHMNSSMHPTRILSSDSHQQSENGGAQELDLHLAGGVVDHHQLTESSLMSKENSELRSRVVFLETELRTLQQQHRVSRDPSPEPVSKPRKKFPFFRRSHRRQDSSGATVSNSTEPSPRSSKKYPAARASVSSAPLEASVSENDIHSLSIGRRSTVSPPKGDMSLLQSHMRSALEERLTFERKLEELREELKKAEEKIETLTNECSSMTAALQAVAKERDAALQENKKLSKAASPKRHRRQPSQELNESLSKEVEKLRTENQLLTEEAAVFRSKMHQMKREGLARDNELRALYQRKQEEVDVLAAELRIAYMEHTQHMNGEDAGRPYDLTSGSPPKWRRVTHEQSSPPRQQSQHSSIFANITGRRGSIDGTPPTPTSPQKQRRSSQTSAPSSPTKSRRSSSKEPPSPRRERASTGPAQVKEGSKKESSPARERSLTHHSSQPAPAKTHTGSSQSSPTKKQSSASPGASPKRSFPSDPDPPHHSQPSPSTGQMLPTNKGQNEKQETELKISKESENAALQDKALSRTNDQNCAPSSNTGSSQSHTTSNQTSLPPSKSSTPLPSSQAVITAPPPSAVIIKPKGLKHRVISVPRLSPISSASEVQSPTPSPPPLTKVVPVPAPPMRKSSDVTSPSSTSSLKERRRSSSDLGSFSPTSPSGSGKQGSGVNSLVQLFNQMVGSDNQPVASSVAKAAFSPPILTVPTSPPATTTKQEPATDNSPGHLKTDKVDQKLPQKGPSQVTKTATTLEPPPPGKTVSTAPSGKTADSPKKTVLALRRSFEGIKEKSGPPLSSVKSTRKTSLQEEHTATPPAAAAAVAVAAKPLSPKSAIISDVVKETQAPTAITPIAISKPKPPPMVSQKTNGGTRPNGTVSPPSSTTTTSSSALSVPQSSDQSSPKSPQQKTAPASRHTPLSPSTSLTSSTDKTAPKNTTTNNTYTPKQPVTSNATRTPVPTPQSVKQPPALGMVRQTSNGQPSKPQQLPTTIPYPTVPPAQRNSTPKTGVFLRRGATVASIQSGNSNDSPQQPAWRSKLTTPQNGLSEAPTTTTSSQSGHRPLSLHVTGSGDKLSSLISKIQVKDVNRAVSPTAPTGTAPLATTPQSVIRSVTPCMLLLHLLYNVFFRFTGEKGLQGNTS